MNVEELLDRVADDGRGAGRSFGPPFEKDGCLVIPVAFVVSGGGGGRGERNPDGPEGPPARSTGWGGGFGSVSWPLGAYVVKDGQVRWLPAVDVTRLVMAGAALVRALMRRRRHQLGSGR